MEKCDERLFAWSSTRHLSTVGSGRPGFLERSDIMCSFLDATPRTARTRSLKGICPSVCRSLLRLSVLPVLINFVWKCARTFLPEWLTLNYRKNNVVNRVLGLKRDRCR